MVEVLQYGMEKLIVDPGELDGVIENKIEIQQISKCIQGNPMQEKIDINKLSEGTF